MDIFRTIKLKKVCGELDNLTPEEKLFFQLHCDSHYEYNYICNSDGNWLFKYEIKNNIILCQYYTVFLVFKSQFNLNQQEFKILISNILDKYLNIKNFTTGIVVSY